MGERSMGGDCRGMNRSGGRHDGYIFRYRLLTIPHHTILSCEVFQSFTLLASAPFIPRRLSKLLIHPHPKSSPLPPSRHKQASRHRK